MKEDKEMHFCGSKTAPRLKESHLQIIGISTYYQHKEAVIGTTAKQPLNSIKQTLKSES